MRRFTGLFVALLVTAVAADSAAQGQGQGRGRGRGQGRAPIRFAEMDANGDRVITRAEWKGSTRSFQVHDWNRDGILSGDEVRVGARQPAEPNRTPRDLDNPWDELQIDDWTPEQFQTLDRDRDGRVTAAEWLYDRETFRRIDHNNDSAISRAEFLGSEDIDEDVEDLMAHLDMNNDGRIARAEWHGTRARFDTLDRNNDNILTRAEAIGTEAPADLFSAIDANNDRAITRNEWRWSTSSFDIRDANRDGRLTREEFTGITSDRVPAYRAGYDRGLIEGRQAGREDRARNVWDLEGQRELEQADSGYQTSIGARAEYQSGYREGFRRGYREGWDAR